MKIDLGIIDWSLLSVQKERLISLISDNDDCELLDGLLHLLDRIQDQAVLEGIEESVVFPNEIKN